MLSRISPRASQSSTSSLLSFFSRNSSSSNTKIYELRTYDIIPEKLPFFIQLSNSHFHLRTAHSRMIGYWTSELGALSQTIHLWEYDSLTQRASIRKTLYQDKDWLEYFVKPALPCIKKQSNIALSLLPWTPLNEENTDKPRAFQLIQRSFMPGHFKQWESLMKQGWASRPHHSQPIGFWKTEFGPADNVYELWAYESFDQAIAVKENKEWRDTVGQAVLYTKESYVKGLLPIEISPLK
ncbi:PREDICTED: protein NipSnap homolog 3B-like [Amphimedon queenslandica]|uniref:NIPSNAP domain-containing protein n=2 Tax=Amphimedon queenslandica TaxID=400682 RepID=A0AAN0IVA9_AMPQE|nr:PREDICTED: protein NipSnap homolog 3B-like [Amphimedon queenslandica]|eukprot:XP_011410331.1 PREDICTED: protein NipSnap homolog 3B-like [Amphimedon queenslandica]